MQIPVVSPFRHSKPLRRASGYTIKLPYRRIIQRLQEAVSLSCLHPIRSAAQVYFRLLLPISFLTGAKQVAVIRLQAALPLNKARPSTDGPISNIRLQEQPL